MLNETGVNASEGRARPPAEPGSTGDPQTRLGRRRGPSWGAVIVWMGLALGGLFATAQAGPTEPELLWETAGFTAPESVVFDAARGQYYVSNMGTWGQGSVPGDGCISRVGADGALIELAWIAGLQSPKGLALVGDRLFAGDDDALIEIDVVRGAIIARHALPDGPGRFNDCTADPAGRIYVFSSRLSTVFRLSDGVFEAWAPFDTSGTGYINGLLAERHRLLLGSWSVKGPDGTEQLGHISTMDLDTRAVGRIGTGPLAHVDGLEPDGRGGYTVVDWVTGLVSQVSGDGTARPILTLPQGAADHTYIAATGTLVIPLVKDGTVRAYRWKP